MILQFFFSGFRGIPGRTGLLPLFFEGISHPKAFIYIYIDGCFQKLWENPPNHLHHPFWGVFPYFWKHPFFLGGGSGGIGERFPLDSPMIKIAYKGWELGIAVLNIQLKHVGYQQTVGCFFQGVKLSKVS